MISSTQSAAASSSATSSTAQAGNSYGSYAGYASAAIDVAKIWSSKAQEEDKFYATADRVGLAVADAYTFGLSSVAYGFMQKYCPGVIDFFHKFDKKFNLVSRALISLFDTDKWKTEGKRLGKLIDQGVNIPEELRGAMKLTRGRSDEELLDRTVPPDFVGYKPDGGWVNNKFCMSRDEKDLHPEDIWGYATFFEKFGNDWLGTFSAEKRKAICQAALDAGAVREHHGSMDVEWTPQLEQAAASLK